MSNCTVYCLYISGDNILIDNIMLKFIVSIFSWFIMYRYIKAVAKDMKGHFSLGFVGIYGL